MARADCLNMGPEKLAILDNELVPAFRDLIGGLPEPGQGSCFTLLLSPHAGKGI